jgi:hypothetical protein
MKRALVASLLLLAACDDDPVQNRDAGSTDGPVDAPADRPVYRSHEGQYCSSAADDDPIYECTPPLVCVNTYDETVRPGDGGTVPIYLCRAPCQPGVAGCLAGDICCPGRLAGGQSQPACVPESRCEPLIRDR